jgi:hypothetical protein
MDRGHILRLLRIAMSVMCLIASGSLIALSVRSNYYLDQLSEPISPTRGIEFSSIKGQVRIALIKLNPAVKTHESGWGLNSFDSPSGYARSDIRSTQAGSVGSEKSIWRVWIPHRFLVLLPATLVAVPWVSRQFCLLTLLIVTPLVAIVSGLVMAYR